MTNRAAHVPPHLDSLLSKAESFVGNLFSMLRRSPSEGSIHVEDERYILIRAASFSVEFFRMIRTLYGDQKQREADLFSASLLYETAHTFGLTDAQRFREKSGEDTLLQNLATGPVHFAHAGWAKVSFLEGSRPDGDQGFRLFYQHLHNFEADSWLNSDCKAEFPVCVMNAGYSAGWCQAVAGTPLEAREVLCRTQGDHQCTFVMAPPHRLDSEIAAFFQLQGREAPAHTYALKSMQANSDEAKHPFNQVTQLTLNKRVLTYAQELKKTHDLLNSKINELKAEIAEKKQARKALEESEQRWRDLSDAAFEGILLWENGRFTEANQAAADLFGFTGSQLMAQNLDSLVPGKAGIRLRDLLDKGKEDEFEALIQKRDGTMVFAGFHTKGGTRHQKSISILAIRDISDRKALDHVRDRGNGYDRLTHLPNRGLILDKINRTTMRVAEREGINHAVLVIDIDNFKTINDSLGHAIGDILLEQVATRLTLCNRAENVVARLSGDEFLVWVENIEGSHIAAKVAGQILRAFEEPFEIEGRRFIITLSIGIAVFPFDGRKGADLVRHADTAMYHAKSNGKSGFQFFNLSMNQRARLRLDLENSLRLALKQDLFETYFQPKAFLTDNRISGLEVLCRWFQNDKPVPPTRFIPVAEENGLIIPLGYLLLRKSLIAAKTWLDEGLQFGRMAINLSPRQFKDPKLLETIESLLEETGFPPDRLEFEITESAVVDNPHNAVAVMRRLRAMKIQLAIDDFGTGYSSLGVLKTFPLDVLKLDRSFIVDLKEGDECNSLPRSIISLAQNLGLRVLAEGVEEERHLKLLRAMRCDEYQGYLLAKPLPPSAMGEFLRKLHQDQMETES